MRTVSKRCSACERNLPRTAFSKHRLRKDGLESKCRKCKAAAGRRWYRHRQFQTNQLFSTYVGMKCRCHCRGHISFPNYGGRGIRVCAEWLASFEVFVVWCTTHGYRPGLQLDRIDNDRGYSPDNCRFVTVAENMRNKRPRGNRPRNRTGLSHARPIKGRRQDRRVRANRCRRSVASPA